MENTSLRDSIKVELVSIRDLREEFRKHGSGKYDGIYTEGWTHELRIEWGNNVFTDYIKVYSPTNLEEVIKNVVVALIIEAKHAIQEGD